MKLFLSVLFVLGAAVLFANEAETNIYPNPLYKNYIAKSGKFILSSHWYSDKLSVSKEKFEGNPTLALIPLKYPWGYSSIISTGAVKLAPGRYCLSVWCKRDKADEKTVTQFSINRKTTGKGKNNGSVFRRYRESDVPMAGRWVELVLVFEVKAGEGNSILQYGHFGPKKCVTVLYSAPRLVKMEE